MIFIAQNIEIVICTHQSKKSPEQSSLKELDTVYTFENCQCNYACIDGFTCMYQELIIVGRVLYIINSCQYVMVCFSLEALLGVPFNLYLITIDP